MSLQDVDVEWFLKQWDGQYNTEWQSSSEVVVCFTTPSALKEALTAFGVGIRGLQGRQRVRAADQAELHLQDSNMLPHTFRS